LDDLLVKALLALFFIFFTWYFVGKRMNKQRAYRFFAVMKRAFTEELGARPIFKSQEEVVVVDPVAPYVSANLQLILETRDILVLWLFEHVIQRKRDQFVLRAEFQTEPANELLIADPNSEFGKLSLNRARQKGLSIEQTQGADGRIMAFAATSGVHKKHAGHLARTILQQNWPVAVISFHKHKPHLVAVCATSPESVLPDFFRRVRRLGFEVLK